MRFSGIFRTEERKSVGGGAFIAAIMEMRTEILHECNYNRIKSITYRSLINEKNLWYERDSISQDLGFGPDSC